MALDQCDGEPAFSRAGLKSTGARTHTRPSLQSSCRHLRLWGLNQAVTARQSDEAKEPARRVEGKASLFRSQNDRSLESESAFPLRTSYRGWVAGDARSKYCNCIA
jgi:hypothetical protein